MRLFRSVNCVVMVFVLSVGMVISALAEQALPLTQPNIGAGGAVVMEGGSGRLLYANDGDEVLPMASTTKIMTTLLVLELAQDCLDEPFVVDPDAIKTEGSSMGLQEGDTVTLRALCYGMMLPSGNDAANAAAVKVGGNLNDFVQIMNERAQELGMVQTHFSTPSGLDDDGEHYSTAYDMALLMREAMQNPLFAQITSTQSIRLSYGNPPYDRTLTNHNKLLGDDGIIGGKTGFTSKAGRCLVTVAERDGVTLICVTLDCSDDWDAHRTLYDKCFPLLSGVDLSDKIRELRLPVVGGDGKIVPITNDSLILALTPTEIEQMDLQVLCQPLIYAPVKQGQVVGELVCSVGEREFLRCEILSSNDIPLSFEPLPPKTWWQKVWDFITNLILP